MVPAAFPKNGNDKATKGGHQPPAAAAVVQRRDRGVAQGEDHLEEGVMVPTPLPLQASDKERQNSCRLHDQRGVRPRGPNS
jgi:hypothetical protein